MFDDLFFLFLIAEFIVPKHHAVSSLHALKHSSNSQLDCNYRVVNGGPATLPQSFQFFRKNT